MKSKTETIKAAAIKRSDGVIVFGKDHSECILKSPLGTCKEGSVQGFITQSGRFVDRVLAGKIAFRAKQILHPPHRVGIISEQIWSSGPCGYNPETGYYFEKNKE